MSKTICFPHPPGLGGPGSFQTRFEKSLQKLGWKVVYADQTTNSNLPHLIFIVGGTRRLMWLFKMKRKGVPIIYRLDGIVWLHKKNWKGLKYFLTGEIRNLLSKIIHAFIANVVIYQSEFVKNWWNRAGFRKRTSYYIIHNGVNIPIRQDIEANTKRLVILEGTIDYSPYALKLLNELASKLPVDISIELYGRFENENLKKDLSSRIAYNGFLAREKVYDVFRGSVYLTLDINPACPNTVAEALACGAPVVGFETGAIGELVDKNCGVIVEYGSDPWSLAYPDVNALIEAIQEVFDRYIEYSSNASKKAAKEYDQDNMIKKYISIFEKFLFN